MKTFTAGIKHSLPSK